MWAWGRAVTTRGVTRWVRCPTVRRKPAFLVLTVAMTIPMVTITACTGGDSTVSKTPTNTIAAPPASKVPATPTPPPADKCVVNLKDPAIAAAVELLPPAPNTDAKWNPAPVAGNYNKCTPISAVIVAADTHEPNPGTRAVFFHEGSAVSTGLPDTYGYSGIDLAATTPDTVMLKFSNGMPGLDSTVGFHWNGTGIEVLHPPAQ